MMTNQAARGTGPAMSAFTPQNATPSLRQAVQLWDSRPNHPCSKCSHHHLKLSLPHDLRPRQVEATLLVNVLPPCHICIPWCPLPLNHHSLSVIGPGPHGCSVVAGRRHCCSTPQPLNHSRRPDWPGAASAPAQPRLPGALSGSQRLRTSLQGCLYHCLMSCFSDSQVGMAACRPWILKVLDNVAAEPSF